MQEGSVKATSRQTLRTLLELPVAVTLTEKGPSTTRTDSLRESVVSAQDDRAVYGALLDSGSARRQLLRRAGVGMLLRRVHIVADIGTLHPEDHILGDVGGVIGDSF